MSINYYTGRAIKIKDGDSFLFSSNNKIREIRIKSIDAPEKGQPFYAYSANILRSLIFGKTVIVGVISKDGYRRYVASVRVGNIDVSETMLKLGAAFHYKLFCKDRNLSLLEANAKLRKVGIWSIETIDYPWLFRLRTAY